MGESKTRFKGASLKSSDNYVARARQPYPDPYSYWTGQQSPYGARVVPLRHKSMARIQKCGLLGFRKGTTVFSVTEPLRIQAWVSSYHYSLGRPVYLQVKFNNLNLHYETVFKFHSAQQKAILFIASEIWCRESKVEFTWRINGFFSSRQFHTCLLIYYHVRETTFYFCDLTDQPQ